MIRNTSWLLLMLAVLWGGSGVAGAQTFDVTVAVTAVIGPEGFSLDNSTVAATVNTEWSGVKITSITTVSLTLTSFSEQLITSGKFGDFNWKDDMYIDFKNPILDTFSLWTKVGDWTLSSATALKYTLDFSVFELVGQTFKGATTTKDGLSLSSSTTVNFEGFKSETFTVSGSISGLSVTQVTVIGKSGLAQSIWDLSATIAGISLFRETIFTGEGFFSDSLSVSWTVDKYDLSVTGNFGKTGWTNASLTASTTFKGLGAPPKEEPK